MAPPSTSSLEVAQAAELVEQVGQRSPERSRHGWTLASAGAVPSTTRSGSPRGAGASRTVSEGSSARTVPAPDEDGVALGPQGVGVGPGLGAGDPLARAVGGGGAAVEGGGQLEHDVGPAGAAVDEVGRQERASGGGLDAHLDLDAGIAQPGQAGTGDLRVGVLEATTTTGRRRRR